MLYMMLKIDAYAIACAIRDAKETKYPQKEYKELGLLPVNTDRLVNTYKRQNQTIATPFTSGHLTSRMDVNKVSFKERKLFGKAETVNIGQITLSLDEQQLMIFSLSNPKKLILYVANDDILKFDVLLTTDEKQIVDVAQFIRENNIFVYDMMLFL